MRSALEEPDTVLIFRLGSLGDTVVALPCFHAVAKRFPNARRVVLTNMPVSVKAPSLASILEPSGLVHGFLDFKSPLTVSSARALRAEIRRLKAGVLVFMAARPKRGDFWRDLAFFRTCGITRVVAGSLWRELTPRSDLVTGEIEPEARFLARTLSELGPIDLDDPANWDLRPTTSEQAAGGAARGPFAGGPFLAVSAGGKAAQKDWGEDNWLSLLREITARRPDLGLMLIGSVDERGLYDRFSAVWNGPVANTAGTLAPREAAAAMTGAVLFIGHDSGPLHLASAQAVPSIGLFGDYNRPRRWHPYGTASHVIHEMRGIRAIAPEAVLAAAIERLRSEVPTR